MLKNLEGQLTYSEVLNAVKNAKNDMSPGTGGFSSEFFKFFWSDSGHFLIRSHNYAFKHVIYLSTQSQGIVSILPKGDKPREYLKNWRPINSTKYYL